MLVPVLALNTLIALGVTLFGPYSFASNLVFSQCIGLGIWAANALGMALLVRDIDTQWRRLVATVPLAVLLGYFGGSALAGWWLGIPLLGWFTSHPAPTLGYLLLSLAAGSGLTYATVHRRMLALERVRGRERAQALQRQATESQLKLLQTQLAPHMLFNTLANLQALIAMDPARAQQMLEHLIDYLRATLSASRSSFHPLQTEFDRLRDYLELMAVRMGPRLRFTLDLPADLAQHPVPTLLLQPLVENSLQHGLEPQVAGGQITVQARRDGPRIVLTVHDSGVGMVARESTGSGFGLAQVRERLATAYGDQGTIEFIAPLAHGTCARITFPL